MNTKRFLVKPGSKVHLDDFDPTATPDFKDKQQASNCLAANLEKLAALQEKLYAQGSQALLVVLQGMDTSGKDGTIEHVMGAFNPQGVQITAFKVPTSEELAHDYLWRIHKAAPPRGMVGILNRSHYEDVLVVRVAKLAAKKVWSKRFDQINDFEKMLSDNGVGIVKFFLHISPEEQAARLIDRQNKPEKQWKFNPGDLKARAQWSLYVEAYEDVLARCSTSCAPWYVVPANRKWFRNLVVSQVLVEKLESMKLAFPPLVDDIASYVIPPAG